MITPSFGLSATERVLPRLALDFTTASLDSRVTFTRTGNTATVTNSSGYVTPINADLPRFDFDPIALVCKGLLIEESRTNITFQSEDFTAAVWTTLAVGATVSGNAVVSPSGALTADKMIINNGATLNYLRQTTAVTATIYTFSLYVKAAEFNTVTMQLANLWTPAPAATFNVATSTITNIGNCTATITPVGNGWYRCIIVSTVTATAGGTGRTFIYAGNNGDTSVTGNGTSGIYIWGAQVEAGTSPTSFIPTVATAVTRNPDVATMTSTNFSSWYNATEGGAVVQVLPSTISGTRPAVEFDDNTANESITLRGVAADPQLLVVDGGATQATLDAGTITANTLYKLGGAWKDASYAVAINGAAPVTQASGTFPTATQARLGSDGTNYLNGHLQSLRFWPQRLTNAEVQAFSK